MRAIVRRVSDSFEKALASYFGNGPTDVNEAKLQHSLYISKLYIFSLLKSCSAAGRTSTCIYSEYTYMLYIFIVPDIYTIIYMYTVYIPYVL